MQADLRKNSHSFLREAVRNAIEAESNEERWPFAILHVVQALELTLKAILAKQHPLFVYEDIDAPKKTVSLTLAMDRLSRPELGIDLLSDGERKRITKAVELRNQITHSGFECSVEYAGAKFAEVFGLDIFLEARHFDLEIDALVEPDALASILAHEKSFAELHRRALERIEADNVPDDMVWQCPQCEKQTFVAHEGIDTCYSCTFRAGVTFCRYCSALLFADDLEDFSDAFDLDNEGSHYYVVNNFGYSDHVACAACAQKARETIEERRFEAYTDDLEREHAARTEAQARSHADRG